MKIYTVSFNDGGWHSGPSPSETVVAENKKEAIEKALEISPMYKKGYDVWATEFKIKGYVVEVYDERTYKRDTNIKKIIE